MLIIKHTPWICYKATYDLGGIMVHKNKNLTLIVVGSICGALITILTLFGQIEAKLRNDWIIPTVDSRIDSKIQYLSNKMEVIYIYNQEVAKKSDTLRNIWNSAVDRVEAEKSNKLFNLK
jgi:hypothetical protein